MPSEPPAVLGFHLFGHDPAVALVTARGLEASWELERVTRDRYGLNLPFGRSGELPTALELERLDERTRPYRVILEEHVFPRLSGRLEVVLAKPWHDRYVAAEVQFLRHLLAGSPGDGRFALDTAEIATVDHNLSHAALAFFASPFERSHVFAYEGMGNDGQTVLYRAEGLELRRWHASRIEFGRSYDHNGRLLGEPLGERLSWSGKLMGLSAYGQRRADYYAAARQLIARFRKASFRGYYEGFRAADGADRRRLAREIEERGGVVHAFEGAADPDAQDWMNSFQAAWTDEVVELLAEQLNVEWSPNVCVSGGCALNVITNSAIRERVTPNVYVPPNPNDSGLAAGAALYVWHALRRRPRTGPLPSPYLGLELTDEAALADYVDSHPSEALSPVELVARLCDGFIVGVVQGRAEAGPRALGNRSILCDPGSSSVRDRLNDTVKFREWFRPFAPVVRELDADRYFDTGGLPLASPYMSFVVPVREEWRTRLPAVTHVDGSARVQTLTRGQNELLWELLSEMERQAGYGVLLNTSFNVRGEPILGALAHAFDALATTGLDAVYCAGRFFTKQRVAVSSAGARSG